MPVWEAAVKKQTDVVVLLSGDSDFVPLVEHLQERGVEVHVIGPDRGTAWELAIAATHFLYASQLDELVQPGGGNSIPVGDRPSSESDHSTHEAAMVPTDGNDSFLPLQQSPGDEVAENGERFRSSSRSLFIEGRLLGRETALVIASWAF
jgi:hypothetical protein